MHESFEKKLREYIRTIINKNVEEVTTTASIDGYSTPFAFNDDGKGYRKKKKKRVHEALDNKDLGMIKNLIRSVIADVLRDIWIKRTAWK
tara:strand:+ start:233 stop:502 length:270 start_codon:yes stop_codon:yes gene_type:complete